MWSEDTSLGRPATVFYDVTKPVFKWLQKKKIMQTLKMRVKKTGWWWYEVTTRITPLTMATADSGGGDQYKAFHILMDS